jgi:hypothetical protein
MTGKLIDILSVNDYLKLAEVSEDAFIRNLEKTAMFRRDFLKTLPFIGGYWASKVPTVNRFIGNTIKELPTAAFDIYKTQKNLTNVTNPNTAVRNLAIAKLLQLPGLRPIRTGIKVMNNDVVLPSTRALSTTATNVMENKTMNRREFLRNMTQLGKGLSGNAGLVGSLASKVPAKALLSEASNITSLTPFG